MPNLHGVTRAELIAIILHQQEQIGTLETQVQELRDLVAAQTEELGRLHKGGGKGEPPAWVKPNRPAREKKQRQHRRQAFVRRREPPPEEVRHALECCPRCGRKLVGGWEHERRQVMEVVIQRRVVDHVLWAGQWGVCRQRWVPKLTPEVLGVQGKRRFGVSVQSLVALLRGRYRVPVKEIRRLLWEVCELHVSDGEMVALSAGVVAAGAAELARLREAGRGSPVVCADETGWREDGKNGFLWTFATPTLRYFEYHPTRSGKVAQEVRGEDFGGTVWCDCYGGYNRFSRKQRCWSHLWRDLRALKGEQAGCPEVLAWVEAIHALYEEAKAFSSAHPLRCQEKRRDLEVRLDALVRLVAQQKGAPHRVLAERLRKHLLEWFVFVEHPAVPSQNNLAERSLRPGVIARKISGGTRSAAGSPTRTGLMSLLGSYAAQGKALLPACRNLLLTGSPG